ncbi:leukocyte immunoglobulin-like receptor subfamily B member 4 [Echinops telfairi]|uniref:Leukocyte immunoglobulin-like receptor subfamily B member 4 n=1 Tax=Echinops telfairi TaxID=9371 RepID=A0AC55D9A8_ECHTE|nr:leukocyte immunoglobulin-like receptor subfamily B member 4 [Echinops telfairi]
MATVLTSLLCLGLSLGQKIQVQAGTLLKPTIWAEPGSTVMAGRPVTIWCQGSLEAMEYQLHKEGVRVLWDTQFPLEPRSKAKFSIQQLTVDFAGRYRCCYLSNIGRSALSDPLDLVMTGVYHKPSLSTLPGHTVVSGENVTLQCTSSKEVDTFFLSKDGAAGPLLYMRIQFQGRWKHGTFAMSPVTLTHAGTYRCYASRHTSPYLLSHPSDPLEITVPELTDAKSKTTAASQDYWVGNCVRLGLSVVILLILVAILAEAGLCQSQSQHDSMGWRPDDSHQRT